MAKIYAKELTSFFKRSQFFAQETRCIYLYRVNLFSVTSTKCERDTLHFALNTMIYVDKLFDVVYNNIGGNRFWAYLIIFEVTDMKKAIRKTKFVLF